VKGGKKHGKRNTAFRKWISTFPCCVPTCGKQTYHEDVGEWLSSPHHVQARGMGRNAQRKPDVGSVVPLCHLHHFGSNFSVHYLGLARFQDRYNVNLWSIAKKLGMKWRIHNARRELETP
jgi:hypothetical protein